MEQADCPARAIRGGHDKLAGCQCRRGDINARTGKCANKSEEKNNLQVALRNQADTFFISDYPYLTSAKRLTPLLKQKIRFCFLFYPGEILDDRYIFGFNQVSEIAVKAVNPGVNDPGTAAKAVDMLTMIFIRKMSWTERTIVDDEGGVPRMFCQETAFDKLLINTLGAIREYGKRDLRVKGNLLEGIKSVF